MCSLAVCHGLAGCCVEQSDAVDDRGAPDIVYELRGATGRWFWFGQEPAPHPLPTDEIGFIWLEEDHQMIFNDGCRTYSGPLRSEDWRRFEQYRTEQVEEALETP